MGFIGLRGMNTLIRLRRHSLEMGWWYRDMNVCLSGDEEIGKQRMRAIPFLSGVQKMVSSTRSGGVASEGHSF
jgi:hypothetical protein